MINQRTHLARLRTGWSAVGAAIAITLGAGGIGMAQASVASGDKPVTVTVDARRILDTRTNVGLAGGFAKDTPREVHVTGSVDVVTDTGTAKQTVVPAGASAVLVNVTVVRPTDRGFLTLRAGGAAGAPKTSTVNFAAGSVEPNAATVDLSADGKIQVWVSMLSATAKADVVIDVVGYTIDHNHDDRYYTEGEVDALIPQEGGVAFNGGSGNADLPVNEWVLLAQLAAVLPSDGYVVMNGSVNILTVVSGDSQAVRCRLRIDGVAQTDKILQLVGAFGYFTHSETFGRAVSGGFHYFGIECRREGAADSPVGAFDAFVTVVFSPNDVKVLL